MATNDSSSFPVVKVKSFQPITWSEPCVSNEGEPGVRQVILLYALGEDGIVYEYANGGWLGLPINKNNIRKIQPQPKAVRR